jgi:hypothetical protein
MTSKENRYAHLRNHSAGAGPALEFALDSAGSTIGRLQRLPRSTAGMLIELFSQNMQDRIRHLHEKLPAQVANECI